MTLNSFLTAVTDIGDTASLIAIVLASSIYLFARKCRRAAVFLMLSLLLGGAFIGALKLFFLGCHKSAAHPDILSPSGHTADSAAVFLAFGLLMRSRLEKQRRWLPFLVLVLLVATIGYSRVRLGFHTPMEVLVGACTGLAALAVAYFFTLRGRSPGTFDAYVLVLWVVVAAFLLHGTRLPMEDLIRWLALGMKKHVPFCGGID